jgi:hypothetical protein
MALTIGSGITFGSGISVNPPAGPIIGQSFGGGFYAGKISMNGDGVATHYLIVSPKSSGEAQGQWKTSSTTTSGTTSPIDGLANSNNMNDGNHPAASFCRGLTIGGYSDWYLPARYELEICFYNLKPYAAAGANVNGGANPYAVPPRTGNYTSSLPAQTTATAFQTGGAQAFAASPFNGHWSSTEYIPQWAWWENFNDGQIGGDDKRNSADYIRAIRKVAI